MILHPPFIPSVLPEIHAYHTFIKASGSSIRMETLHALDRFVRDCYNAGIWSSLIEVYPFCGDNLAGAMSKLKNYAIAPACTAVNFVESDYVERGANGGIAGNGSTKYIDTNFSADNLPANAHISIYLREDVSVTSYQIGVTNNAVSQIAGVAHNAGVSTVGLLGAASGATEAVAPMAKGFYQIERQSATSLALYRNNASIGTSAANIVPTYPAINIYALARNLQGTGAANYTNKRISFASIGLPMSNSERLAFYNAVQNLQTNLGRNV
jgi:hypothetical protein